MLQMMSPPSKLTTLTEELVLVLLVVALIHFQVSGKGAQVSLGYGIPMFGLRVIWENILVLFTVALYLDVMHMR